MFSPRGFLSASNLCLCKPLLRDDLLIIARAIKQEENQKAHDLAVEVCQQSTNA